VTTFASHTKVPAASLQALADVTDPLGTTWVSFGSVAWTATGSAPVLGNGQLTANYMATAHTYIYFLRLVWGSTTTGGTGDWRFNAAFNLANANNYMGGVIFDTSATKYYPAAAYLLDTTPHIQAIGSWTAAGVVGNVSATHPITFASGDILTLVGSFQK